ncbi:AMP-binding protein [Nocardioides imazamoxiresistens]|uniref:AMP-binding protein n=1 Tax=Nocardioides imazamoxiresistens TaxID=3231893 RepID=UPI0028E8F115|nr:AMP-binding protein [Nocardioides zeae]
MSGGPAALAPATGRDVGALVDAWARAAGGRVFLRWAPFDDAEPATWTRAEFAEQVDALARGLHARGLRRGDRFAISLPNGPAFLLTWTALASLGAVAVCLNPRLSPDELEYALGHSGARGVLTTPEGAEVVATVAPDLWLLTDAPTGPDTPHALAAGDHPAYPRGVAADAPASIQYTSGTTSRPKAVVWTQAACLWAGQVGALHQGLGPADVNLVHLPLFHTNGLSYSFLSSLWSGGELVLQPRFSASRFWPAAVEHRATWSSVVSFCLRALEGRDVPERHHFRGWGSSAALPAPPATAGVGAIGWFGMTETVSHPVVGDLHLPGPAGSMGRPSPAYAVRVVAEDGTSGTGGPRAAEPDEPGELQVLGRRGVSLFSGYLGDDAATAAAFTGDGWFRTGDRVRRDAEGHLWFLERDKDVLKVGGENIGTPEVERVLRGVEGVGEAVVVGRPDRMLGEVPVAFVVARPGERVDVAAAHERCVRMLADFKRPREIRVVDALPRSTLDKVAKAALRRQLADEEERSRA